MPKFYKKRNQGYKRYSKKIYKPKMSSTDLTKMQAYKAYRGVRMLKGIVNAELKKFDTNAAAASIDFNGVVVRLSTVQAGDDVNNRQGNSILAKKDLLRMVFRPPGSNPQQFVYRLILFIDTQFNGTNPTSSTLLESAAVGTSNIVNSPLNIDNGSRFIVLRDKIFSTNNQIAASTPVNGSVKNIKLYAAINKHIKFTDTTTGGWTNQLFMLVCSDSTTSSTIDYWNRLYFYDN